LSAIPREKERGTSKQGKGADENWERTQNSIKRQQGENVATEIENNFNTSQNNAQQMEQKSAATTTAKTRRKSRKR